MFSIKLDFCNSKETIINDEEIEFYDEISLIDVICNILYENQVKFVICDNNCDDYGMDCKFDLPCLFEAFNDIISGLKWRKNFHIEFYEQGRVYLFSFFILSNNVKVNIKYGYDDNCIVAYELDYDYIKAMFVEFYKSAFCNAKKYIEYLDKNDIFIEWNTKLNEL